MLKKYFGYEFKESAKTSLMFFLISIIASINFGVYVKAASHFSGGTFEVFYTVVSSVLFGVSLGAVNLGTFIVNLKRYWNTMYTDQGYFTHTLPIDSRVIYWSKIVCASIWSLVAAAVSFLDMIIIEVIGVGGFDDFRDFFEHYDELDMLCKDTTGISIVGCGICMIICSIVTALVSYIMIFLSMAVGNLAIKHKKALGTVVCLGIYVVMINVIDIVGKVFNFNDTLVRRTTFDYGYYEGVDMLNLTIVFVVLSVIFGTIMYLINRHLLRHKLNI